MVTAIVLLNVEKDKVHNVAETLVDINEITEVYSVTGEYDLAVIIRHKIDDKIEGIITEKILKAKGIINSETLIAFRVYSRYNLERLFEME
jgi:DNA-binding Lrp family transcriptional regulator